MSLFILLQFLLACEMCVPGNVLIVDHHVKKKICIYIHKDS